MGTEGQKSLFWGVFKVVNEKYSEISVLHTGDQEPIDRHNAVLNFQDKKSNALWFLGTVGTCNAGINLTASSLLFQITSDYTPSNNEQVWARVHRIGSTGTVNIYQMWVKDTIDDLVKGLNALPQERQMEAKIFVINSQRSFLGVASDPYYLVYRK